MLKPNLKLFQFNSAFGARNISPFCFKLETYLRMSGIEHEIVWSGSTRNAPKGKLPYIEDDSQIVWRLGADHRLSDRQIWRPARGWTECGAKSALASLAPTLRGQPDLSPSLFALGRSDRLAIDGTRV